MKKVKLIFIPGWGTDCTIFKDVVEQLQLKNGGKTALEFKNIEWVDCLSDNVDTNALYLELESSTMPVLVLGWSIGGIMALLGAAKYPKKVSALFLISTTAKMIEDNGYFGVEEKILRAMINKLNGNQAEMLEAFFSLCLGSSHSTKELVKNAQQIKKESLLSGLVYLKNCDIRGELSQIECPVRIIHGKKDRVVNTRNGLYLKKKLPRAEIKTLADEEHLFFYKKPSVIADEILDFLTII